jgi:hypothetical protein
MAWPFKIVLTEEVAVSCKRACAILATAWWPSVPHDHDAPINDKMTTITRVAIVQ